MQLKEEGPREDEVQVLIHNELKQLSTGSDPANATRPPSYCQAALSFLQQKRKEKPSPLTDPTSQTLDQEGNIWSRFPRAPGQTSLSTPDLVDIVIAEDHVSPVNRVVAEHDIALGRL